MFILPSTLAFYDEPPRQTWLSLPMSVVWSLFTHVAAIVALLYLGLPTSEHLVSNTVPLTLVEPSLAVPAAAVQAKQLAQTDTSVPQTKSPSEPVRPPASSNAPLAAPTAIATTTTVTVSVAVPPTLQADSAQKSAVQSSVVSPSIGAAQALSMASVAPVVHTPTTELPSSSAAYLNNPPPTYPAQSRRLGEQGIVKWRVLIGTDGKASEPELAQSSGFARLDEAAKQAVLTWRYVPGKRAGVAEAMRYVVPIHFN